MLIKDLSYVSIEMFTFSLLTCGVLIGFPTCYPESRNISQWYCIAWFFHLHFEKALFSVSVLQVEIDVSAKEIHICIIRQVF